MGSRIRLLNDYFTFSVIDMGHMIRRNIKYGTILSIDAACAGSSVIIMLQKVNKQVEEKLGILSLFMQGIAKIF